jgi:hypothetical protein
MAMEQDGMVSWAPPQQSAVVNITRVRAERAEQRAAVLAGRAATYETRLEQAEELRDFWKGEAKTLGRSQQCAWAITWGAVGLAAAVTLLAAIACLWAMGWRGPLLVGGILVAAAAWIALPKPRG